MADEGGGFVKQSPMKMLMATLALLICFASTTLAGELEDLKVRAEEGNAIAQFNLGLMYDQGQGVPQDYSEAVKWFRKAAEQGEAKAQAGDRIDSGRYKVMFAEYESSSTMWLISYLVHDQHAQKIRVCNYGSSIVDEKAPQLSFKESNYCFPWADITKE